MSTLGYYDRGATPFYACPLDQRFSYCLFVPEDYDEHAADAYHLVVCVHGTNRPAAEYRNALADFARENRAIVLAPLFPVGISAPGEMHDYKFIDAGGVRYDDVLLSMVDEVATRYRVDAHRLLLHGFSGGGHFAHRFLTLHPDRLAAVSIGAPGMVTLLDEELDWWTGVRDLEERFGVPFDLDAMRRVAVQMVIGGDDVETWEITLAPEDPRWVPGANDAGVTRLDRMAALRQSYEQHGIEVRQDVVPGVGHRDFVLLPAVQSFFADCLAPASATTRK